MLLPFRARSAARTSLKRCAHSLADRPGTHDNTNAVYDWGFSLVPERYLTTTAVIGWGPGSSD